MQKNLFTLTLAFLLVVSACGSSATESTSTVNETATSTTVVAATTVVEATTDTGSESEVSVEEEVVDEGMAREEIINQLLEILQEEGLPIDVSDLYDYAACVVDGVSGESNDSYATMLETILDDEDAYGSEIDDILPGCTEELESFLEQELSDSDGFISESVRIEFDSGSNGASVEGELTTESLHAYVLGASAGQTMTIWLDSPDKTAVVDVWTPEGDFLTSGSLFANRNSDIFVTLPDDGDYYLDVYLLEDSDCCQSSDEIPYELTVFVEEGIETEAVQFLPEDSWTVIEGGVLQGERGQFYELTALADQAMLVSIESLEDNAVYDVISPSGNILLQEKTSESTTMIVLPEDGKYLIRTGSSRGNTSYTLTVDIWSIPFVETVFVEEFGRTAILEGGSLQGEPGPVYIVPIEEGLKYAISVTSIEDNAVVKVVAPNGDVLVAEDTGAIGTAFEGGDYLIQVGGTRGNVSYTLEVTLGIE